MSHVLRTPMRETFRTPDGRPRWCFQCRKHRRFLYLVHTPTDPDSYYGPSRSVRCGTCGTVDGDLFPGRVREWSE